MGLSGRRNKEEKTTIQENKTNHQNYSTSLQQTTSKKCGSKERGMERKVDEWREKKKRNQKLNQTPNQDRLEVQFSS